MIKKFLKIRLTGFALILLANVVYGGVTNSSFQPATFIKAYNKQNESVKKGKVLPNVVILLADDLGYGDLSSYGSKEARTPSLDKLAGQGMRFTNFYAASAVCSPSRAALLTGRFSVRAGVYSWIHASQKMHLHRQEITIAELLKTKGFKTAHMGKWHLGYNLVTGSGPAPAPHDQGFNYWLAAGNNAAPSHRNPTNFVRNGKAMGEMKGYSSQIVVDEALTWLQNSVKPDEPFFLNLWFHEPHVPVAAPDSLAQRHAHTKSPAYYGSIENMDAHIGRFLQELERRNLADNTIIIFMSDNGSERGSEGSNGPLKGNKTKLWEGGIRVPAIIRWPGKIKPGSVVDTPAGVVDILPTICAIADISLPNDRIIDGVSLVPLFQNKNIARHKPLFWFYNPSRPVCVIRDGDWSLVADPVVDIPTNNLFQEEWIGLIKDSQLTNFRLYNLKTDIGQEHNVAASNQKRFEGMKKTMIKLHREVVTEAIDWRTFTWTK